MLSTELAEGLLPMELAKVTGGWLWRNGRIDNMPEVGLGCFGRLVVKKNEG
jgi:hypothetical protein